VPVGIGDRIAHLRGNLPDRRPFNGARDARVIARSGFVRKADEATDTFVNLLTFTIGVFVPDGPINLQQREDIDMLTKSLFAASVAGFALCALPLGNTASAAVTVKTGMLTCHVGHGFGFVFGSSRDLACTYEGNGRVEHYTGDISKFGVDIGYLQSGVIVWAVLAPTTDLMPGALGGAYGGVTAGVSAAVGGSANVLVGGSTHEVSLQPLSIEGDKGLNVAAGIAAITLKLQS
jgi:hypothetical protein